MKKPFLTPSESQANVSKRLRIKTQTQPKELLRLALLQTVASLFFSVVLYFCFDLREALSALLGGFVAIVGSLYSAGRLFTTKQHANAQELLMRFYISVVLKIILTLLMMGICIIVLKVSLLPFIIAFLIAAVVINLLVLLLPSYEALSLEEERTETLLKH